MALLTIEISHEEEVELKKRSDELGLTPEALVRRLLDVAISPNKLTFHEALQHTLQKNAELYRRLS